MTTATYVVEADWGDDGSFAGNDVITGDVVTRAPLTIDRGVDTWGGTVPLGGTMATAMTIQLRNDDFTYHPENTGSALYGNLEPGKDTRVRTTAPSAATLGRGFVDELRVDANPDSHTVTLQVLGGLAKLVNNPVSIALKTGLTTGDAIGHILDAVSWPAGRRNLDSGATVIPNWFLDGVDAIDALRDLMLSEGPGAALFEDGSGDVVFHDRHHRFTAAASKTSQTTFRGTGTEPVYSVPHRYDSGHERIVNRVEITPRQYLYSEVTELWRASFPFVAVAAGASTTFVMELDDPAVSLVTPIVDTWSNVLLGSANVSTDIAYDQLVGAGIVPGDIATSFDVATGTRIELTITNNHGSSTAYLRQVRVRGIAAVGVTDGLETVVAEDATSQTAHGVRTLTLKNVWMDLNTAQDLAAVLVNDYKDPQPVVTIELANVNSTRLTQILTREVNDRITVNHAGSGMSRDFYIDRISHAIGPGNTYHRVRFVCVAVGSPLVAAGDVFIFDDATQGKFDTGKLGY